MEIQNLICNEGYHLVRRCGCGGKYQLRGKSSRDSHNRSKRHQKYIQKLDDTLWRRRLLPFDCGYADAYYSREYKPKFIIDGESILDLTLDDIAEYKRGYESCNEIHIY